MPREKKSKNQRPKGLVAKAIGKVVRSEGDSIPLKMMELVLVGKMSDGSCREILLTKEQREKMEESLLLVSNPILTTSHSLGGWE